MIDRTGLIAKRRKEEMSGFIPIIYIFRRSYHKMLMLYRNYHNKTLTVLTCIFINISTFSVEDSFHACEPSGIIGGLKDTCILENVFIKRYDLQEPVAQGYT